jgi:hypothetical protein
MVSNVSLRDSGDPIVTIQFSEEEIRFNADSFDDTAVSISLPAPQAGRIIAAYEAQRAQPRKRAAHDKTRRTAKRQADKREQRTREAERASILEDFQNKQSLWYMTHIRNLPSILRSGILSHATITRQKIQHKDVSDLEVQHRRSTTYETVYGRPLHDYVPLYFNPHNPMLSKLRANQHELIILEISPRRIMENQCVVSDGNAASPRSDYYELEEGLMHIDWALIRKGSWYGVDDGKRRMCAEVLVPDKISAQHFITIHCYSDGFRRHISSPGIPVKVSRQLYF